MGTGLYIVTEDKGETVGIREGWNGWEWLVPRCSSEVKGWGNLGGTPLKLPSKLNGYYYAS